MKKSVVFGLVFLFLFGPLSLAWGASDRYRQEGWEVSGVWWAADGSYHVSLSSYEYHPYYPGYHTPTELSVTRFVNRPDGRVEMWHGTTVPSFTYNKQDRTATASGTIGVWAEGYQARDVSISVRFAWGTELMTDWKINEKDPVTGMRSLGFVRSYDSRAWATWGDLNLGAGPGSYYEKRIQSVFR